MLLSNDVNAFFKVLVNELISNHLENFHYENPTKFSDF